MSNTQSLVPIHFLLYVAGMEGAILLCIIALLALRLSDYKQHCRKLDNIASDYLSKWQISIAQRDHAREQLAKAQRNS